MSWLVSQQAGRQVSPTVPRYVPNSKCSQEAVGSVLPCIVVKPEGVL